ncbi:hypothetical protein M378DRAFT_82903 [Amanita muscaria Koide BX008]|uniref:Saccharopine dehydrogenase NADP binding domain-containing protein n=1 Tax=Amanita muscaria (strain Koide BX008) TaxID=946122 RepID=A0A0C2SDL1_AMAMK|nr:hypothetical protein M378DRAFT_82903 [Amanita muscaria Koide BX008]
MLDIVVLGATGFTGRLISRYLASHPQRGRFSWAVAARSKSKLDQLAEGLSLPSNVARLQFNVNDENNVDEVVKSARVVINTIGPFALYGTPVVRACVKHAVHYVDMDGEAAWIYDIIEEFDDAARKKGTIIVPCCAMDSIPSDLTVYLSNKTLKAALEEAGHNDFTGKGSSIKESLTGYQPGKTPLSGGTLHTVLAAFDGDRAKVMKTSQPYSLSPVTGVSIPIFQALYKLCIPGEKPLVGGFFMMRGINTAIVQRSFGLLEVQAEEEETKQESLAPQAATLARKQRYGPLFKYDEFLVTPSTIKALLSSYGLLFVMVLVAYVRPFRQLARKFVLQPGDGPTEEEMINGYLIGTNLTTSATNPPIQVKSTIKIDGSPGYLRGANMISECALSLLLPPVSANSSETTATYKAIPNLPSLARRGGVLTASTAFGDTLIQRLVDSGSFEFYSSVVGEKQRAV